MAAWSDWLAGPEHTDALAQRWAALLARHATQAPQARVALALDGELGAGKSHFSRALLRAIVSIISLSCLSELRAFFSIQPKRTGTPMGMMIMKTALKMRANVCVRV